MNLWNETKSIPISRSMVWEAYLKVRSNKGSAGVDKVSMEEFDANRRKHPTVKFDFLGYSFQPRSAFSKKKV